MKQQLIFTNAVDAAIEQVLASIEYDKCYLLCDENSRRCVLPCISSPQVKEAQVIEIPSGEENKSVETLTYVWQALSQKGATRHSLLINLGGGVVTDLGGFAAATFKRGIAFVNIPTTLLAAVDAAVGGKTGINLGGLKNEVGAFSDARAVIVSTCYFSTISPEERLSGYAEMIKHALIDSINHYEALLGCDVARCDEDSFLELLRHSVGVKERIVEQDPREGHLRKTLNLGHTVAHAIESHALAHGSAVPHGYAVAWGLICALILSHRLLSFPSTIIYDLAKHVEGLFGAYAITCDDYDELLGYMQHDKKNMNEQINFTLLRKIGECEVNVRVERKEIEIALDFYRDLFHL